MCLAVPMRLKSVEGAMGVVEAGGAERPVGLALLPEAQVGDYILLHAGYAIKKIDEEEAAETLKLLAEFAETVKPGP